jgi:acyl CoA:acetate/3-ketoacid CoA transferase alpha subunit
MSLTFLQANCSTPNSLIRLSRLILEGTAISSLLSDSETKLSPPRRSNKKFEAQYLDGQISLELVPQGTLVERIRAHAAGIPAFFTPTGASTAVEDGLIPIRYNKGGISKGVETPGIKKEAREIGGRRYLLEPAIAGDVAFVRAWKVDEVGNCVFRCPPSQFHLIVLLSNQQVGFM